MKKIFLILAILPMFFFNAHGNTPKAPDFSYPKDVLKQADTLLDKSLKDGDGRATVDALIRSSLAAVVISADSLPAQFERVAAFGSDTSLSPATRSLLNLLAAQILTAYYSEDSYALNRRTSVEGTTDITLMSGAQIKERISELLDAALADRQAISDVKIGDFAGVIECNELSRLFYPTLTDFISARSLDLLEQISANINMLSPVLLTKSAPMPNMFPVLNAQMVRIADEWVRGNAGTQAPLIMAIKQRFEVVSNNMAAADDSDTEKFAALMELYRQHEGNPYAVELLLDNRAPSSVQQRLELYNILKGYAAAHPDYVRINSVTELINTLSDPSINFTLPRQVALGQSFKIKVNTYNIASTDLQIYRVRPGITPKYGRAKLSDCERKPCATIGITGSNEPVSQTESLVDATVDAYGYYVICCRDYLSDPKMRELQTFFCSDIVLYANYLQTDAAVWAINGATGEPIKDVQLSVSENRQPPRTYLTDANGCVDIPAQKNDLKISSKKGQDTCSESMSMWLGRSEANSALASFVRTDLAIYHPGDTVQFVATTYSYKGITRQAESGRKLKVALRDANYQEVDTLNVVTDEFGRCEGTFKLPDEGLTGYFTLNFTTDDTQSEQCGYYSFMVSDYKLPTYEVTLEKPIAKGDTVVIRGRALTYSDFPVAGAGVEATLSASQGWWFWRTQPVVFERLTAQTGADGRFEILVTPEIIASSPYPKGLIAANLLVTSPSGENRSAETKFSIGKPYTITATVDSYIRATDKSRMDLGIVDRVGNNVEGQLLITLKDNHTERSFEARSINGHVEIDLSGLESGEYKLSASPIGFDAEPLVNETVSMYNPKSKLSPSSAPIWVEKQRIKVDASKPKSELVYAVPDGDARVLLTVNTTEKVLERRWLKPSKGINKLNLEFPGEARSATVTLVTVKDMDLTEQRVNVDISHPNEQVVLTIEHLRDRVQPLLPETLKVKVTDGSGKGLHTALILDMYCKALDAIQMQSWQPDFATGYLMSLITRSNLPGSSYYSFSPERRMLETVYITAPELNLYGQSYAMSRQMMLYSMARPMKARSMKQANTMAKEESIECEMVCDEAAPMADTYMAGGADNGAEAEAKRDEPEVNYRPSEVALGFFAPMLTTEPDGSLSYSFTVPNANTTWVLNALAFNTSLANSLATAEIISSKPVMVEPNMPRFIRQGDTARVRASVMNATDSAALVTTVFEVLDPADMSVIATFRSKDEIAAGGSATPSFGLEAKAGMSTVIIRVRSTLGNYTDGVQTLLPILPASQQIIDSEIFYLAPDCKDYSHKLPKAEADSEVIVSFCENPTWEVVSALPGLLNDADGTALAASAQIFAAAVSGNVLDMNPAIKAHLQQWIDSKDDKALLSKLNQDEGLKQLVLASTPWVQEAANDAQRIERLTLLFDPANIQSAIKAGVATLESLQTKSGGWRWSPYSDTAEEWTTLLILNNFAELRALGCLPVETEAMIKKAWKFIDAKVGETIDRYPDSTFFQYTYIRSLYPEIKLSGSAKRAYDKTMASVVKHWRSYPIAGKAAAAMMLYRYGKKVEAKAIMESIRQHASSSPELGMWWDNTDGSTWWWLYRTGQTAFILQAFNEIEPGCEEIDQIRQWLILQKTLQDWGTSVNASACVASILRCGSNWLSKPGDAVVKVDGKQIKPTELDALTGQFVANIENARGKLTIERTTASPAWGSIMNRSMRVMTEVEPHGMAELSIEKDILVCNGDTWVATDSLSVGQVAKIRLIINARSDMDYVTVVDNRAACMEPVIQTPRPIWCDNLAFYLENRNDRTNLFINRLAKGQYVVEYEMNVNNAGSFTSGVATIQSQYTPEYTAHSGGRLVEVAD